MKWRRYEFLVRTMNSYKTYEFNGGDGVMGTRVIAPVNSMVRSDGGKLLLMRQLCAICGHFLLVSYLR